MTAYRDTEPSETAMQWARWKRVSFLVVACGIGIGAIVFGCFHGCAKYNRNEAEIEARKPCLDELQYNAHGSSATMRCSHRDHAIEIVTYQADGAALCRCRVPGFPKVATTSSGASSATVEKPVER